MFVAADMVRLSSACFEAELCNTSITAGGHFSVES
jgi:hypothetical protein